MDDLNIKYLTKTNNLLLSLYLGGFEPKDFLFLYHVLPNDGSSQLQETLHGVVDFQELCRKLGVKSKFSPMQEKLKNITITLANDYREPAKNRSIPLVVEHGLTMSDCGKTMFRTSFTPLAQQTILPQLMEIKDEILRIAVMPPENFKLFFFLAANCFRPSFEIGLCQLLEYLNMKEYVFDMDSTLDFLSKNASDVWGYKYKTENGTKDECCKKIIFKCLNWKPPEFLSRQAYDFAMQWSFSETEEKKYKQQIFEDSKTQPPKKMHNTPCASASKTVLNMLANQNTESSEKIREWLKKTREKNDREWKELVKELQPLPLDEQTNNPQLKGHEDDPELREILAAKDLILHGQPTERDTKASVLPCEINHPISQIGDIFPDIISLAEFKKNKLMQNVK